MTGASPEAVTGRLSLPPEEADQLRQGVARLVPGGERAAFDESRHQVEDAGVPFAGLQRSLPEATERRAVAPVERRWLGLSFHSGGTPRRLDRPRPPSPGHGRPPASRATAFRARISQWMQDVGANDRDGCANVPGVPRRRRVRLPGRDHRGNPTHTVFQGCDGHSGRRSATRSAATSSSKTAGPATTARVPASAQRASPHPPARRGTGRAPRRGCRAPRDGRPYLPGFGRPPHRVDPADLTADQRQPRARGGAPTGRANLSVLCGRATRASPTECARPRAASRRRRPRSTRAGRAVRETSTCPRWSPWA